MTFTFTKGIAPPIPLASFTVYLSGSSLTPEERRQPSMLSSMLSHSLLTSCVFINTSLVLARTIPTTSPRPLLLTSTPISPSPPHTSTPTPEQTTVCLYSYYVLACGCEARRWPQHVIQLCKQRREIGLCNSLGESCAADLQLHLCRLPPRGHEAAGWRGRAVDYGRLLGDSGDGVAESAWAG